LETAIGVFAKREGAEEAVKALLEQNVPEQSIDYLTRSESDAKTMAKQLGAYAGGFVGGAAGLSAGVAAATLLAVPGLGAVFALGFGAAALLGLVGAGTGAAIGKGASDDPDAPAPTSGTGSSEDSLLFHRVLNEGHSLIVVRTESPEIAKIAAEILNRTGMNMEKGETQTTRVTTRQLEGARAVDITGKIAHPEGTILLRDSIQNLLAQGATPVLLNLESVEYVDSAGIGEIVRTHATIRSHGGQLKIVNPSRKVRELLQITKLDRVLEIEQDEASALNSLRQGSNASKAPRASGH
jgi:anti-sigma B factor antagonist